MIAPDRQATLNRSQTSGPADTFRTRDGWVLIQSVGGPLFERWVELMGEPHWLDDPRFKDDISRGNNGAVISERLSRWCAERSSADVLREMEAARIPAGPVMSPQQVLDDPHAAARGVFKALAYPGAVKPAPVMDTSFSLSATPTAVTRRAPTLGEHTDQIMNSLGYSHTEIAQLKKIRVI